MSKVIGLFKPLLSRKWWWVTLLVLALMAVLFRLGIWQVDRLEQRRAANVELAAVLASPAVELATATLPRDPETFRDRQVTATGRFDFDEQVSIKLQNWQGQPGVYLVAPLVFADGTTAVLVNRGWIPDEQADPTAWSTYDVVGEVTVPGYAALSETLSRQVGVAMPEGPQRAFYRVDISTIGAQMPYDLLPIFVVETPPAGASQVLPFKAEQEIDLSEGPHLSYAIQWFIFGTGLGIAYVVFVNHSEKRAAARQAAAEQAADENHEPASAR